MYCNKCGSPLDDGAFCSKCGASVTNNSQNEISQISKPKKGFNFLIPILGVASALLIGGGIYFYNDYKAQEEAKIITAMIDDFEVVYSSFQKNDVFDMFDKTSNIYEDYEDLLSDIDSAIKNSEHEKIETLQKEITSLENSAKDTLDAEIEDYLTLLEDTDFSRAFDWELDNISTIEAELTKAMSSNDYSSIYENIDSANQIIEDIQKIGEEAYFSVEQIDTSLFPTISIYVDAKNSSGELIPNLNSNFLVLTELVDGISYNLDVLDMNILDKQENLCISLVADVSGSMIGNPIYEAKVAMNSFVNQMQFDIGDMVELVTFSDDVEIYQSFTTNKDSILYGINQLNLGNLTSLYDALYIAVNRTATQTGAKYVMAFTDGQDNSSSKSIQDVINASNYYRVPIYIVSIGYNDTSGAIANMAKQTGGEYYYISQASDITAIYEDIYRNHKDLYKITYETKETEIANKVHNLTLDFDDREYASTTTSSFEPNVVFSIDDISIYNDEIETAIGKYLRGFVSAINSNDYSYLRDAVIANSPMESIQSAFILNNYKESLTSYEILSKTKVDDYTYHVETREAYNITYPEYPNKVNLLLQEASYIVKKDSDGVWRLYGFLNSVRQSNI